MRRAPREVISDPAPRTGSSSEDDSGNSEPENPPNAGQRSDPTAVVVVSSDDEGPAPVINPAAAARAGAQPGPFARVRPGPAAAAPRRAARAAESDSESFSDSDRSDESFSSDEGGAEEGAGRWRPAAVGGGARVPPRPAAQPQPQPRPQAVRQPPRQMPPPPAPVPRAAPQKKKVKLRPKEEPAGGRGRGKAKREPLPAAVPVNPKPPAANPPRLLAPGTPLGRDSVAAFIRDALPFLLLPRDFKGASPSDCLAGDSCAAGRILREEIEARLQLPREGEWGAALSREELSERLRGGAGGRGLSEEEARAALLAIQSYPGPGRSKENYHLRESIAAQTAVAEVLYLLAMGSDIEGTTHVASGALAKIGREPPPFHADFTEGDQSVLKAEFHDLLTRANCQTKMEKRLEEIISLILDLWQRGAKTVMSDRRRGEEVIEPKEGKALKPWQKGEDRGGRDTAPRRARLREALRFAAEVAESRERIVANTVKMADAVLCESPELHKDGPFPPPPSAAVPSPPHRESSECFIFPMRLVRLRAAGGERGRGGKCDLDKIMEEHGVICVKKGQRITTPYDDDIGSYNWMGTVTRIAQNARGAVFLEVKWDWCLLDEVQLDLDLRAAGRRQAQNQDLLKHFLGNPVNSRIYYEGRDREEDIVFRLDRYIPPERGLRAVREIGEEEAGPHDPEGPKWKPWESALRRITPSHLQKHRGLSKRILLEINAQNEYRRKNPNAPAPETLLLMGTYKRERFQTHEFSQEERAAARRGAAGAGPSSDSGALEVIKVLEPCSGCGGLSGVGGEYELEGRRVRIEVAWGVDIDAGACQSFSLNHVGAAAYNMRMDEFMALVYHFEVLARDLLDEGPEGRGGYRSDGEREGEDEGRMGSDGWSSEEEAERRTGRTGPTGASGGSGMSSEVEVEEEEEEEGRGVGDAAGPSGAAGRMESESEGEEGEEEDDVSRGKGRAGGRPPGGAGGAAAIGGGGGRAAREPIGRRGDDSYLAPPRIVGVRLWKKGTASSHPYEYDRGDPKAEKEAGPPKGKQATSFTLPEIYEELENMIRHSDLQGGACRYTPESLRHSYLEIDVGPPHTAHVDTIRLDTSDKVRRYAPLLRRFILEEKIPRRGGVGMIASGPPCQALTGLSWGTKVDSAGRTIRHAKNNVLLQVMRGVEFFRPSYIIIENVVGSVQTFESVWQLEARTSLARMGYQYRSAQLDAARYQTPQTRRRVIIFAARPDRQLPPVPRPFNRDPLSGRTLTGIFSQTSSSDHSNMSVTAADLDPLDFDNPPAVMADVIGRKQDLADNGCEAVSRVSPYLGGEGGLPQTPLQLLLRLTEDAELDRLRMFADAAGLYSYRPSRLPSLSLLHYLPKQSRQKAESTPGRRIPADYAKIYPTLYTTDRSELVAFAEAKTEGKRGAAGGGVLRLWADRDAAIRARDSRLDIVGTTLNHNIHTNKPEVKNGCLLRDQIESWLDEENPKKLEKLGSKNTKKPQGLQKKIIFTNPDGVSNTLIFSDCFYMLHPIITRGNQSTEDWRFITPREAARLQTFPDCLVLAACGRTAGEQVNSVIHQIANAVPCHLAMAIGSCVARAATETHPVEAELAWVTLDHPRMRRGMQLAQDLGLRPYLETETHAAKGGWKAFLNSGWEEWERATRAAQAVERGEAPPEDAAAAGGKRRGQGRPTREAAKSDIAAPSGTGMDSGADDDDVDEDRGEGAAGPGPGSSSGVAARKKGKGGGASGVVGKGEGRQSVPPRPTPKESHAATDPRGKGRPKPKLGAAAAAAAAAVGGPGLKGAKKRKAEPPGSGPRRVGKKANRQASEAEEADGYVGDTGSEDGSRGQPPAPKRKKEKGGKGKASTAAGRPVAGGAAGPAAAAAAAAAAAGVRKPPQAAKGKGKAPRLKTKKARAQQRRERLEAEEWEPIPAEAYEVPVGWPGWRAARRAAPGGEGGEEDEDEVVVVVSDSE